MLRCMLCGRPAGDDPVAAAREREAAERAKVTGSPARAVWICPMCSGKSRHEAEEAGHGLKGKNRPPL
ncbi:hypothetical protein [Caldinitratiruptor microaerophilus]|nr:hypothetical protein [Caldinitratiruptor microaerophilus]